MFTGWPHVSIRNRSSSACLSMSRRQCSVCGCSNRKGRCPEDVDGKRHCKCLELQEQGCPESSALLSLHNIGKMPNNVYQTVVQKLNQTRKVMSGAQWKPGSEAYICNFHYEGFKGPSRAHPFTSPLYSSAPTTSTLSNL